MTQQQESLGSLIDEFDRGSTGSRAAGGRPGAIGGWKRPALALVAIIATIGALTALAIQFTGRAPDYGSLTRQRTAKDAVTGELFEKFHIKDGDTLPWVNPKTGQRTLYPVERCYWTRDGKAKTEPTFVILNEMLGKEGPTICPDCAHVVVRHNPEPPIELVMDAFEREKDGRR